MQQDNYAPERFSYDGVDRSMLFDIYKHSQYLDWFLTNYDQMFRALCRLADDESREIYIELIRYKLAGHLHVRLDLRIPNLTEQIEEFKRVFVGEPSQIDVPARFGQLMHYDHEWGGARYTVDTLRDSLLWPLVYKQYFFERGAVSIKPQAGDHLIDGGAFIGDATVVFSKTVGANGRVYSFDPVQEHLDILRRNCSQAGLENVTIFEAGLGNRNVKAPPFKLGGFHPGWKPQTGSSFPMLRIDDLVREGKISRIDFIKLDVEGAELETLRGAAESLRAFKPKLAISIYHKPGDLPEISDFLYNQNLGYRFYIKHHTIWDEETVLYATV